MPKDIALYMYSEEQSLLLKGRVHSPPTVGQGVLTNKVLKFLLTSHGSDSLRSDYGSRVVNIPQISTGYLPTLQIEFIEDLTRCIKYIKDGEASLPPTTEKLYNIKLIELYYDEATDPSRLDFYIQIITNKGNTASLPVQYNLTL